MLTPSKHSGASLVESGLLGLPGVLLAAMLLSSCAAKGDRPGLIVLPGMDRSVPFDPYDPNPNTPTGGTLMHPPEGTVPSGMQPFPYGPTAAEATRAGIELHNPLSSSDVELHRGAKVYVTFCQVCHGPNGDGDGPIIGRFPNPPSLQADHAKKLPDGHIFHIITFGQKLMPSYAVQIRPADRWRAILYLRKLQKQQATPDGGA